jgi:hypothetical protein
MSLPDVTARQATLPAWRVRALSIQGLLLAAAAFVLPAIAHVAGLPVRVLLPMHWPVLLVGLCYGWRSGLIVGLAAPSLSYLISGMPVPAIIPAMTLELATYGFLAGLFRGTLDLSRPLSTVLSILGGRVVFLAIAVTTGAIAAPLGAYLKAALIPGIPAALGQILLLPFAAAWWVRREQGSPDPHD